jgi:transglutaminase-like putative cysteine protease
VTADRQAPSVDHRTLRRVVLDQRIRYSYSSPVTDLHQHLKVVPPAAHGSQRRRRWHLEVDGVPSSSTRASLDPFGNLTIAVDVPRVEAAVEFVVNVEADSESTGRPHLVVRDRRYLEHTPLTEADDAIIDLALTGSPDAESLCQRVHQALTYQWGITDVHTTASEALTGGRGVCQDYAHIMLAACRAAGQPARYVSGHLTGEGGSHAWVETLRPHPADPGTWLAEGWDPTHNRRTDVTYLAVAVGRDYTDTAPMSGTFEGEGVTGTLAVAKRLSA